MQADVDPLIWSLASTREILQRYGETAVSARLAELERGLAAGDWDAIESAVSEATGGMGSLRDVWLSDSNGNLIEQCDEPQINAELDRLIVDVERTARETAARLGISLVR